MENYLIEKKIQNSEHRLLHMNNSYLKNSHDEKQFNKHNLFNNNIRSLSSSPNACLKEYNLTEKDFHELQEALKTIFYYTQSKLLHDDKRRLTSPYLQQPLSDDDQSSLPLYTNEYFIRNGLLNHNDGPEIHVNHCQSMNLCYSKPTNPLQNCSSSCYSSSNSIKLTSSVNISLPLTLLSNRNHLFTALTSNFTLEKMRRSQSNIELSLSKYREKSHPNETKSMMIRRKKVQAWERENYLQQPTFARYCPTDEEDQLERLKYHHSSIIQIPSITQDEKLMEKSIIEKNTSLKTVDKRELLKKKNNDDLFPMIKILGRKLIST